jgi:hypothetical protein
MTATQTMTQVYAPAALHQSYVFPQPAIDTLNIIYSSDTSSDVQIYIYNAAAMPVADFKNPSAPGFTNKAELNISRFASGVYYYIIRAKDSAGREVNYKPGKFLVSK